MSIQLRYRLYYLEFTHPFGVSSNTRSRTPTVFLELGWEQHRAYGEACLPAYLGETVEATELFLEAARSMLENLEVPFDIGETMRVMEVINTGSNAAKAAIDIALHDLLGKMLQMPVSSMYGLEPVEPKLSSFTIGIDKEEKLAQKIEEAGDFNILKIKAGTNNDRALIETVRRYTDKPLYVDLNQAWTDKHQALELAHFMKEQNVLLLEQPMPVQMHKEMAWFTERSPLPTFADESAKRLTDLPALKGVFSGINIKLMKSGGILEATKMVKWCRANNLQVMLGCMAESSCATGAMAQIINLADYIDLDAPLLYQNDPFLGPEYHNGLVSPGKGPGIGVSPKTAEWYIQLTLQDA